MVPVSTASAIVPLDMTTRSMATEKNAATGKESKLADARPSAATSAIQQKMIPSPRTKFIAKPPSGYNTSMPSSSGNSKAVSFAFTNMMAEHASRCRTGLAGFEIHARYQACFVAHRRLRAPQLRRLWVISPPSRERKKRSRRCSLRRIEFHTQLQRFVLKKIFCEARGQSARHAGNPAE